ncbi:HEPN domain-containing protein [Xanthocytophaga agilis]|uniref:HEPN domain-containing protein n=1 Tax=Xanthocytophaga agilis TaxID=3048010 RepID=A0AAE3UGW0_9BACT|nr:HEPN domain-containing protein [Xanthocytophaga agilis]MDJ1502847.1 HEPN domain-containing protein [Xanthocytophaga agilis]
MQSFRTELENPLVEKEIIDLEKKIALFREGKIHDEKFRSLRLVRGIYGQRQPGVQMIRIKLPFGKMTVKQMLRIADVSDEYATGNMHLTTRQDVQIHFVSLDKTPELWAKLAHDDITIREACGNTVRNVTASANAGIDPEEPFDVSPYADAMFRYFLRNSISQELGRKFKIAFSSSDKDTGFTFMHDIGLIPKVKIENGKEVRGFKVMLGGGLGAQPYLAFVAYEFLEEDKFIPFTEGVVRIFDRYGERNRRHKARLKFLIEELGFETFMELVAQEQKALKNKTFQVDTTTVGQPEPAPENNIPESAKSLDIVQVTATKKYKDWYATNVFEQKQKGFYGVQIKVHLGDIPTVIVRKLAPIVETYAADDVRVTVNQGLLLKYVRPEYLPYVFAALDEIGLAEPGFDSTADVTACPGTDTCNLAISSSTGISAELERVMNEEYPDLIHNQDIKIKISGCMNGCAQHSACQIGFHGSSVKKGAAVLPALQVMLGGGIEGNGIGSIGDKVIKVPSRRGPDVLRWLINDYEANAADGEYFNNYYRRQGKDYFYKLLKPLANLDNLSPLDYVDWGKTENFETAIGVGECAGVVIDLVSTLFYESEEKLAWAKEAFELQAYADSIYHSYAAMVSSAKAFLLTQNVNCNSQHGIMKDFDTHAVQTGTITLPTDFKTYILQINENEPSEAFATSYMQDAIRFHEQVVAARQRMIMQEA